LVLTDLYDMTVLPSIHELVTLRDRDQRQFRTRVEGVGENALTVTRPRDLPAEHTFDLDSDLQVAWNRPTGVEVVPARLAEITREGVVGLWGLEITGEGWREQRRAYVRAPVTGKVTMSWAAVRPDETEATPLEARAQLSDVSEAGLRCQLPARPLPGLEQRDVKVMVDFDLDNNPFRLSGSVLHIRPHAKLTAVLEVVVLFAQPGRQGDALRKIVYNKQMQEREAA
jgi:PilZ domain